MRVTAVMQCNRPKKLTGLGRASGRGKSGVLQQAPARIQSPPVDSADLKRSLGQNAERSNLMPSLSWKFRLESRPVARWAEGGMRREEDKSECSSVMEGIRIDRRATTAEHHPARKGADSPSKELGTSNGALYYYLKQKGIDPGIYRKGFRQ